MIQKVLIIGLGQIGMGYDIDKNSSRYIYSHARAFSLHPSFELIAAVDPDENQRELFSKAYSCPAYESIKLALSSNNPDVVVVATPTNFHYQNVMEVLGCTTPKVVVCEKPLSYSIEEAQAIVEKCSQRKIALYVNYMRRSDQAVIEVKRRIDKGDIAPDLKGVVWYSKGFLHNASHFVNLLEYWLGDVKSTFLLDRGRFYQDIGLEPDVRIRFSYGTVIFLSAWEEMYSHYTIELVSKTGRLRYEKGGQSVFWQPITNSSTKSGYSVLSDELELIESGMDCYQWNVCAQLAKAIKGDIAYLCSGQEALTTLKNMKKIVE